jgi:hypothetical protein
MRRPSEAEWGVDLDVLEDEAHQTRKGVR